MDLNIYFYFVTVLSIIYSVLIRFVQGKTMDKNLVKEVQDKTKQLNELNKEIMKGGQTADKRKQEELQKLNDEMMPKMNAMMMGQMKTMAVVLIVFFAFSFVSGHLDPNPNDDFTINMTSLGNGSFTVAYPLKGANSGLWYVAVKAIKDNNVVATQQAQFFVGAATDEPIWNYTSGSQMNVSTGKLAYLDGENVIVHATNGEAQTATATFNNGTRFYVDLPVTIPLLNLRRIYDSQSWFIFSALIFGLIYGQAVSLYQKYAKKDVPKTEEKK